MASWQETYEQLKKRKKQIDNAKTPSEIKQINIAGSSKKDNISIPSYTNNKTQLPLPSVVPLRTTVTMPTTKKKEEKRTWFNLGAFDDGYDFGDITKTILGTSKNITQNLYEGALGIAEKTIDTGAYGIGLLGDDKLKQDMQKFIEKDLIDEEKIAKYASWSNPTALINQLVVGDKSDEYTVLGEKSQDLVQSAGQLAGTAGLQYAGVPWWLTTGTTSFGGEVEQAFKKDATYGEAGFSGLVSAGAEILTEKISGGISFGGKTLDKGLKEVISEKISNKAVSNLIKFGLDATGEGFEEVATEFISTLGQQLSYEREETWNELLNNEEAMDSYINQVGTALFGEEARANYGEAFIGGAVLGGGANVGKLATSNKTGRDYDTGLTTDETVVVEAETNRRIDAQEKAGKKLTAKEKAKIEEQVKQEVLKKFSSSSTQDIAPVEQINQPTTQEVGINSPTEFESNTQNIENNPKRRNFTYDSKKVTNEYTQATYESASKVMNDTEHSHKFVDVVAKIATEKNTKYEFTNNEDIKNRGYDIEGKQVNGLVEVNENGESKVLINIDSPKALNTIVGHETTHLLEGTQEYKELQKAVFEYAKTKGEFNDRQAKLYSLYKNVKGANVDSELTADLVGDYLFTDSKFIESLSIEKPSVFKKIKELIDDLVVKFTGTKEEKQLREVQKKFREAYRQETTEINTKNKYALNDKYKTKQLTSEAMKKFNSEGANLTTIYDANNVYIIENNDYSEYNILKRIPINGNEKYISEIQKELKNNANQYRKSDSTNSSNLEFETRYDNRNNASIEGQSSWSEFIDRVLETVEPEQFGRKNNNKQSEEINGELENSSFFNAKYSISDNQGRELTKEQQEYFKDSKVRDEKGNLLTMYHGTPNGEFNTFKPGSYFSANEEYATGYQNPSASSISYGKQTTTPKTYEVYLNITKPFTLQDETAKKIYIEEYIKGGNSGFYDPYTPAKDYYRQFEENDIDWLEGEDLREWLIENHPEYDGLILDEGGDGGYGMAEYRWRGLSYMPFNSNQVKNVDNTKPTSNEDIRYSISEDSEGNELKPAGDYNVYGEDVKLQEAIAPLQEKIETLTETIEDLKEQIAPVKEDIDRPTTMDDLEGWEAQNRETPNNDIAPIRNNLTAEESHELDVLENVPFDLPVEEQARKNELEMKENNSYYMNDTMTLDKKSLKALSKNIKDYLGLNNKQRAELENVIQEYSMQENATKEDLYEIIENRFGKQNIETKLDDIIDAQTTIRRTKIKPTDDLRQMTDYYQTKQKNFGRISMSNNGMEVDKVYQELSETYKDLFPDTITNPADQFERIIEVANMSKTSIEEITLPEDAIQDVTDFVYESVQDYKYSEYVKDSNQMYEDGWENINIPFEEVKTEPELKVSPKVKPKQITNKNVDWDALEDTSKGTQQQFNSETMELEDTVEKKTKKQIKKELLNKTGIIGKVLDYANKIPKILMENTDPIRLQEMIFGRKLGNYINKNFFQKVKDNTSAKIRFQNKERAEIKALGIKARSKESAAVQKYGEGQWTNEAGEVLPYGDKELASEFPDVKTQEKIKRASKIIRQKYDMYLDLTNKVLTSLGYDAIPKRKDYMRHFQELNDIFSRVGIPYNYNEMTANDLPTDINGLTADFSPSKNFFASALRRKGVKTTYDAITGIDGYLEGIGNLIYHTEDIQRLRAFEEYIRETYGESHGYDNLEMLTDEEKATRIEKIQDNHLSNYASWLHEYTNTLAGKKALVDRSVESLAGRRIYSFLNTVKSQVGKNMIGFNISSALTNVIAEVQAIAKTSKLATIKGLADTVKNIFVKDGFVEKNNFLTSRFGSDMLSKNLWQRAGDAGFIFMRGVDNFISQLVVRSKYNELKSKGLSDAEAHEEAGKFASRVMGDRSQGATANIYNSQMLGLVTQFQLEVNNQLYSMFYDTYHESKERAKNNAIKTSAGMTYTLGQLAVFTHLFGAGFEAMAGYNPTFDIIGMLMTAFGLDDEEEDEDTTAENLGQAFEKLVDALPYVNIITGGGRIPVSEALPLEELFTGKDEFGNDKSRVETLKEALPYYGLPTGYSQIKKTTQGLGMYDEDLPIAGSYTDSGNLRFTAGDSTWDKVQAGVFGRWANKEAQAYVDSEFKTIDKDNVDELIDLGMTSSEYRKYRTELSAQKKIEDKIEYINDLDVTDDQKTIMANNVLKRDYDVDMGEYDDFGSFEEFDYSYKNPEKYEWFKENGISYEDYSYDDDSKRIYNYAYKNPDVYKTGKAITGNFEDYMKYKDYIYDLKADKDSDGNSISGTRKTKVISYVNELDLSIPQKAMLIRQEYSTFDDYNYDIVEYVDNLDIDYEDKVSILEGLDMKVSEDGTISW